MYSHLIEKYGTKKAALSVLGDFIINYWITSTLKFDENLIETGKVGDFSNTNAEIIRQIIRGIIKNDYKNINSAFQAQFNHMLNDLRLSILNYLCEMVNIEVPKEKK